MFGRILNIEDNRVVIENTKGTLEANLLNIHVVFVENDRKVVGEIIAIDNTSLTILLLGEIRDDKYVNGLTKKPTFQTSCRIITKNELEALIGKQATADRDSLLIGTSHVYENYKVSTSINDFFSNHFAIIGNTGSGKSCGVARVIQNLFLNNDEALPVKARFVLFDAYGEYNSAFDGFNRINGINFKHYSSDISMVDANLIKIPPYFLEVDDLALLLHCNDSIQLPIIENALRLVYIFKSQDPKIMEYKNNIIAKNLRDILSSGRTPTQIRDQLVAVLSQFHTDTLNLDTQISQPGYTRTLRQCLNIDNQGKMNSVNLVMELLDSFVQVSLGDIDIKNDFVFNMDDLYYAFEFALIDEGVLNNEAIYEVANSLKVRLQSLINSDYKKIFEFDDVITKEEYINRFFKCSNGEYAQLVNLNFSDLDDRFAKVLTKIFAKLFFDFTTRLSPRASQPFHLVIEEAHRYVQRDNDIDILGYNIFDRITKEGRKYGTILGLITQRPSELSQTSLSQCSNFLVFRMFHPKDLQIVSSISSNVTTEMVEKLKNLRPGNAMVFGTAFKLPLITKLELPNPMPQSTSVVLTDTWF